LAPETAALAARIAQALGAAQRPLVISGPGCHSEAVIKAAANVTRALRRLGREARVAFTVPESNSLGLALLDCEPVEKAFAAVHEHNAKTAIVLENDLYRRAPAEDVEGFFLVAEHVIVLDHLENATTARAELTLPAGTFAEADGTLINNEARAQRFLKVFVPPGDIQESWRWLRDGVVAGGRREFAAWETLDDVIAALVNRQPALKGVAEAAPPATFRMAGEKIPREPYRYSGRTAMLAQINVSEPKPPDDVDSPLSFSMEGNPDQPPSALIPFAWSPGWNSYQAWNKFQEEIAGPLRGGNPGVRLIEAPAQSSGDYFRDAPPRFQPREGEWLVVPLYHIFGSEELSVHSPGVNELSPKGYLAMNDGDAARLRFGAEELMLVTISGKPYQLPLKVRPDMPAGVAGVPDGIEPLRGIRLPAWGRIVRVS
jgi:NADH-quinone oxidoreductase subunit G